MIKVIAGLTGLMLLGGGLAMWAWIVARLVRGRRVVPWQPRRPVPWHGIHVLAVVWTFLLLMMIVPATVVKLAGAREAADATPSATDAKAEQQPSPEGKRSIPSEAAPRGNRVEEPPLREQHGIMQLLRQRSDGVALAVCFLSAAVTAPLCEEFIFRLVLQGWWETRVWRWRRRQRLLRYSRLAFGLSCILPVAVLFGAIHYRAPREAAETTEVLLSSFIGVSLAHVLTILAGIALLRFEAGATATDLGWDAERLGADVALGLLSFAAMAVIVYPLQFTLAWALPRSALADPFSLTVFGVGLGVLYLRTHRIVPAIVLHLALNATTLLLWAAGLTQ